jgi:hypothetical protein
MDLQAKSMLEIENVADQKETSFALRMNTSRTFKQENYDHTLFQLKLGAAAKWVRAGISE